MTSPLGSISLAQQNLLVSLADCDTFRAWVGASTEEQARARIHHEGLPPPANGDRYTRAELRKYRPYVVIWTDPEEGFAAVHDATSEHFEFAAGGRLKARFEQDVDEDVAGDPAEIDRRFKNVIGQILDELGELAGTAGYLACRRIAVDFGPYRSDVEEDPEQGDFVGIELGVEW